MPRRRKPSTSSNRPAPRVRPELRPSGDRDAVDEPDIVDEIGDLDDLDDAEFDRRLTGAPDQPARGGTAVGVLLGLGVLLGAVVAYVTGLPILAALVVGGMIGAIGGIVIDRRRAASAREATL